MASAMDWIITGCSVLVTLFSCLYIFRGVYIAIGAVATRSFPPAKKQHRYGILIAARNEEAVIGQLLDSIAAQRYPADRLTVFVVADNCSPGDRTAEIARAHGAVCYERHDPAHRTKGYALSFLLEQIRRDFSIDAFDGYMIFDADNLLAPDYIARMNDAFDSGEKIITSYRMSKNFFDNWISFTYSVHWLSTVRFEHRARSLLGLATRIQGTGYLFAAETVRNGWPYTSLTEDRAFAADAVVNGYRISYCHDAVFYDEQPVNLRIALRQRVRWAKGNLQVFADSGFKLFRNIFRSHGAKNKLIAYDMFMTVLPESLVYLALNVISLMATVVQAAVLGSVPQALFGLLSANLLSFFVPCVIPLYVLFAERKRIPRYRSARLIESILMWPFFSVIGSVSMAVALFCRVEWKPIPHTIGIGIDSLSATCGESTANALPSSVQRKKTTELG